MRRRLQTILSVIVAAIGLTWTSAMPAQAGSSWDAKKASQPAGSSWD